jgi:hypothetical protein
VYDTSFFGDEFTMHTFSLKMNDIKSELKSFRERSLKGRLNKQQFVSSPRDTKCDNALNYGVKFHPHSEINYKSCLLGWVHKLSRRKERLPFLTGREFFNRWNQLFAVQLKYDFTNIN